MGVQYNPLALDALKGTIKDFVAANMAAKDYLAQKTTVLTGSGPKILALDCADARIVIPNHFGKGSGKEEIVYCTAAQAITDETIAAVKEQFPSITEVKVYGHTSCGGCGVRKMLDDGKAAPTPELQKLGESLTNADPYQNAKDLAKRFGRAGFENTQGYLCSIPDGVLSGPEGDAHQPDYSHTVGGWDMRLGQNPPIVLLNLGLGYSGTEYVFGSKFDAPNAIFDVTVVSLDSHAQGSLQYAFSHAGGHTENAAGCSFNDTQTFVVMVDASREADARVALEQLSADATFQQFMGKHKATGAHGRAYLCLHEGGVITKIAEAKLQ